MDPVVPIPPTFLRHAWREALRYGDDDWVFLRELIQNARDARARHIEIETSVDEQSVRIVCRDDGTGMSRATLEEHLLRLFSSTKAEDAGGVIGRFGVGFWSVLRFHPGRILVDTVHESGRMALEIDVAGSVARVVESTRGRRGTTVELERGRTDERADALAARVRERVLTYAGPVTGVLEAPPPTLSVAGEIVRGALDVEGVAARPLKGRGFEGAIAIAREPKIRLYARGLLVREASSLEELLPRGRLRAREHLPGLAVSSTVNADDLSVLLDRQHVVESPTLYRIVDAIDRQAARLERDVLERLAPLPLFARLAALDVRTIGFAVVVVAILVGAGLVGAELAERVVGPRNAPLHTNTDRPPTVASALVDSPRIDTPADQSTPPWAFRYEGPDGVLFRVSTLAVYDDARGLLRETPTAVGPARLVSLDDNADRITVWTRAEGGAAIVLPVPPRHRVVAGSLLVDGANASIERTVHDEALLFLAPGAHDVTYATAPFLDDDRPSVELTEALIDGPTEIPAPFLDAIVGLERAPIAVRIAGVGAIVKKTVRYTTDALDAGLFARSNLPFLERVATFRAGDCDVQNGTVVLLLRAVSIPARLAVGLVGERGQVARDFHAWAEVSDGKRFVVVDVAPERPRVDIVRPAPPTREGERRIDGTTPARPPNLARSSPTAENPVVVDDRVDAPLPDPPTSTDSSAEVRAAFTLRGLALLALAILVLGLLAVIALRARHHRRVELDGDEAARLTESLLGEVARARTPSRDRLALRLRRFLPTREGKRVSLDDVADAVLSGRAARATKATLSSWPLPRGAVVLDGTSPLVHRVAPALRGVVDLDAVNEAEDSPPHAITQDVERAFLARGARVRVILVDGDDVATLRDDKATQSLVTIGRNVDGVARALEEKDLRIGAFLLANALLLRSTALAHVADDVRHDLSLAVLP